MEVITGSRKRARAKVMLKSGTGIVKINSRDPLNYFGRQDLVDIVNLPLKTAGVMGSIDVRIKVIGGGIAGQAGAVCHGIARALVNDPSIVMADEPTGNLDTQSGDELMELLLNLNKERGTTLIIVTHDPEVAELTQRVVSIRDGVAA